MIAKITRLSKKSVKLEMTSDSKKLVLVESLPHSLGNIEQAQLFILGQAREWDENVEVQVDKEEEFTAQMFKFGRTIIPFRGALTIKVKQEDGIIQEV